MRPRHPMLRYAALPLALAAAGALPPATTRAQDVAPLSSGSGAGTGTGRSSVPDYRPDAPLRESPGMEGPDAPGPLPPPDAGRIPLGPGVNVRFPDDPGIAPFLLQSGGSGGGAVTGGLRITPEMIDTARLISEPGERGRIMLQIARGAILSNQLVLAHRATEEAATAAPEETNDLIHDQLIISIVTTAGQLADSLLREGKPQVRLFPDDPGGGLPHIDGRLAIRTARLEWRRAAAMASQIRNPTYRSEYLDRAVENMAVGSAVVALEYAAASIDDRGPQSSEEDRAAYADQADEILEEGATLADEIERPIWRNRAKERLATAAGESGQYQRATDLADRIRNAEARARALVLVAEFQARRGRDDDATRSYNLAARAVASVQQRGLRGVLIGILIDSLISTGRFEDARASLVLYQSEAERFVAMGAIAESLGVRRMPDEARAWIDRDAPAAYRSTLYRRLNNGLLRAISEARAREFQGHDYGDDSRVQ